ncbi:MAG: DUF4377 domain-containing protein [Gilvibacter sp.]
MKKVLLLLLSIGLFACSSDDGSQSSQTVQLYVHHFKTVAVAAPVLTLLAQEDSQRGSDTFIEVDYIRGFDFEPGFEYELEVEKITTRNAGTQYSTTHYQLISVTSKTAVANDVEFSIILARLYNYAGYVNTVDGNTEAGYSLLSQIPIDCSGLCGPLGSIQRSENAQQTTGVFTHGQDGTYVLRELY